MGETPFTGTRAKHHGDSAAPNVHNDGERTATRRCKAAPAQRLVGRRRRRGSGVESCKGGPGIKKGRRNLDWEPLAKQAPQPSDAGRIGGCDAHISTGLVHLRAPIPRADVGS